MADRAVLHRRYLKNYTAMMVSIIGICLGCESPPQASPLVVTDTTVAAGGPVKTGAQVLAASGFNRLQGQRVGLIVNHTARVDTAHLADLLHEKSGVTLAALFGPEHGLRGTADAGESVQDGRDIQTGAPIYSLYGNVRKPTPEMLAEIDVLVFDIQDIGARFYTYISTMGLAMQAAAEADVPFIVLDRPNPLGGNYVSGFMLEPEYTSFVGQYQIPVAHGLTVGELARLIKGEQLLPGLESLQLEVVQLEGWERGMTWGDTGLPWVPPSPNIPDVETALVYPGACFFEAVSASEGRGTRQPFLQLGAPWADGSVLADTLNARSLPGTRFSSTTFTPESIPGMSANPRLEGELLRGIRQYVTDPDAYLAVETGIHVLHAFYQQAQNYGGGDFIARPVWMAKLSGTKRQAEMLASGARPEEIIAAWQDEVQAYREQRKAYLLY